MTSIQTTSFNYPSSIQAEVSSYLDTLGDTVARTSDHVKTFFSTTFDPVKQTLYFLFPSFGAYWTDSVRAYEQNPTQEACMPLTARQVALLEINRLAGFASLNRNIILYTKPESTFYSYGGGFSIASPALFAPHEHIFRVGLSSFGSERPDENMRGRLWHFSDNEVRFLICRELGRMKYNDQFLRVVAKVILISFVTMACTSTLGIVACIGVGIAALTTYLLFCSRIEYMLDSFGKETLGRALGIDDRNAKEIARGALSKMALQNLDRRSRFLSDAIFVTTSGNDFRNYNEPFLTARLSRLN